MKSELLSCHNESPSFQIPKHEGVYSGKFLTDEKKKFSVHVFMLFQ